jgi:hypothetical protein
LKGKIDFYYRAGTRMQNTVVKSANPTQEVLLHQLLRSLEVGSHAHPEV